MKLRRITVCAAFLIFGCGGSRVPPSDCAKTISDCIESCESGRAGKDDYSTTPSSQRDTRSPCEKICYRSCGAASTPNPTTPAGATPTGAATEPMPTPEPPPLEQPTPTVEP